MLGEATKAPQESETPAGLLFLIQPFSHCFCLDPPSAPRDNDGASGIMST